MNTPKEDTLLMELDSSTGPSDAKTTKRKERKHFPRFENHLLVGVYFESMHINSFCIKD